MNINTINIAVVDDHKLFRQALTNYLENYNCAYRINIIYEAADGNDLSHKINHNPVEILIMDLYMQGMDGLESIKKIKHQIPEQKILMLSMCTDLAVIGELLDQGIHGYISKADEIEQVPQAIISIHKDLVFQNKIMTDALYFARGHKSGKRIAPKKDFSDREIKILKLLWEEKTNKEIADELFLGVRSIEKLIHEMKDKINAASLTGLLKYCIHHKIIL